MTQDELKAMKLALEALEGFYEYGYDRQECFEHITAIKEALAEHAMREVQRLGQEIEQKIGCVNHDCDQCKAQPEQEPVATVTSETGANITMSWWHEPPLPVGTKLYTHPPQNVIDKSAAKRIATALGWTPPLKENT